ncbi:HAMP domain-containing histidine kinase [Tumebacillus sp. ITR2]|uniref:histidine kinase n=1 Tax=Tumebacillus amylolyticus TaxID=2801339 RepID=A0ABS1J5Q1_9BACL|nr:HAMP domain-containing sensor histidine kinase [Tumebacillus amylolyticus]MBL0385585.1 HAMP domain-containing histidine kinase [Tumebacillus amylolyticus]
MNRISVKLGFSIVVLFLMVYFPIGYVVDKAMTSFFYQHSFQELDSQSEQIALYIRSQGDLRRVQDLLPGLQVTSRQTFVLDADEHVIAHSGSYPTEVPSLSTQDWQTVKGSGSVQKQDTTTVLVARPILVGETLLGAVVMTAPLEDIAASITRVRSFLLLAGIGALFLALGFTIVLSRRLSAPLLQLERVTRQIARGELDVQVKLASEDEMGSLAQAINSLAADLKQYRDSRAEFFVNISHELRTPLTYIEGYIQVLRNKPDQTASTLQILEQEAKRMRLLVNDLFDLAQLEEGKLALLQEWVDLSEIVDTTIQNVKARANEKGVKILFEEDPVSLVYLDGYRAQQILLNLLDNALRYTNEGMICIRLTNREEHVLLSVRDTGIGIPQEELPYIFDRFYRVEKSRSRDTGGTGLGLSIVKKLIDVQNGRIEVRSQAGWGTEFVCTFPLSEEGKSE